MLKYYPSRDFHRSTPIWARPGFWKHILDQIWIFSQSRRKGSAKVKVVYARILMFLKWENTEIHLDPFMICSKMFKIRFSVKFTKAICFFRRWEPFRRNAIFLAIQNKVTLTFHKSFQQSFSLSFLSWYFAVDDTKSGNLWSILISFIAETFDKIGPQFINHLKEKGSMLDL